MAKILLLAPPYLDLYGELSRAAGRYFPLGLAYLASYLRKFGGHEVGMYEPEAQGLGYSDIRDIIIKSDPDIVGLTCSTPNFSRAMGLAALCRKHSRARIVLGGVHATAIPEFIMQNHADLLDCVVVGEGEETMLELAEAFGRGEGLNGIKGIVYMEGDGVVRTEPRPFITELDSMPFPARDLIPQHLFMPNTHNARHRSSATMLTSRGCPFNCTFCAARLVSGKRYRTHSPEYVLEEMQMLKRDYGVRQILITDDTFTINRARLVKICEGMISRRLNLSWFCFSQVNTVNRETLSLMKKAGCYNIGFGVESADEEILKAMGKKIKPSEAIKVVQTANDLGMKTQAFYIFGSPGEGREQMLKTIALSKKVNSTLAFFNMLVPYPGTRDFDFFFSGIPLKDIDWENFVAIGEKCVLSKNTKVSSGEIERLIAQANLRYYFHPGRALNLLRHIRTSHELSNHLIGGLSFLKQIFRWYK
jgi:radical SAM superfamily enzyme YgiQ (UPF0313 family)